MDLKKLNAEWDKVKIHLMSDHNTVFLSSLVFSLKLQWKENIQTAQTNGLNIAWNPDFFLSLSKEERLGVTVHEACHVAFDHIARMKNIGRDHWKEFQMAADHAINLYLKEQGFKLPGFALADPKYKGWSTEAIYNDLVQSNQSSKGHPWECISTDPVTDPATGDPISDDALQSRIQDTITRAALQSGMSNDKPGSIPNEVEAFLQKLRKPELPWTQLLMRKIASLDKTNYNFKKPRRRYLPDMFLPERSGERTDGFTAYIDISGSVADYQFTMFIGELAGAFKFRKPKWIRVVQFDTRIISSHKVKSIEELKNIPFHGRGGTDIHEVFEDIKANKNKLSLIFTDGGFHFPVDLFPDKQRVIWMINDNPEWKAPKGDTINFSTERYKNG